MLKYNDLRIEGDCLHVTIQVENKPYFDKVKLTGVRIDTPLTYGQNEPFHQITQEASTILTFELQLPQFSKELILIIPQYTGEPSPDTPCNQDVATIGVVYNKKTLLQKGLGYLKELGNSCVTPKGFIDFILRQKALEMSIETCNPTEAIKYWEYLHSMPIKVTTNNCRCHEPD